ncbi:MAG: hypothetical protein ACXWQO_16675 [Bdellovibrionota bacterium]
MSVTGPSWSHIFSMTTESIKSLDEHLEEVMLLENRKLLSLSFEDEPIIPAEFIERLRSGEKDGDILFDRVFPERVRFVSTIQWSPIEIAQLIFEWLKDDMPNARFVDMGSGVGKLCLLLSLLSKLQVTGIEQRLQLVNIAREIAEKNAINARFEHMNCVDVDWNDYDVFYFYNPFQEHIASGDFHIIDTEIELDRKFHVKYTEHVRCCLEEMAAGKRLITYHGFGGDVPASFDLIHIARVGSGRLCLWEKMALPESQFGNESSKDDPSFSISNKLKG